MDGGDDGRFRELLDRFQSLEASHVNLRQQFDVLLQEKPRDFTSKEEEVIPESGDVKSFPDWGFVPGTYFSGSPYRNVLEYMGHAVHVSRTGSWEINYWYFYNFTNSFINGFLKISSDLFSHCD